MGKGTVVIIGAYACGAIASAFAVTSNSRVTDFLVILFVTFALFALDNYSNSKEPPHE